MSAELMAIRADTLYIYDSRGRMVANNEPDRVPAPRLFVGRMEDGWTVRFGQLVPDDLAHRVTAAIAQFSPARTLEIAPVELTTLRSIMGEASSLSGQDAGPAYRFPTSLPPYDDVVQVTAENVAVVEDSFRWLVEELQEWWPCFALVNDGSAVSLCFSARIGARACEAGVQTLPSCRGRGYATRVTAAWAAHVRASGRIPLYSTAWDNTASQGVARRLGLIMFGSDVTFE